MTTSLDAFSKMNDAPQMLSATVTTNTTTVGSIHDLSNCIDQVVAVTLTVKNNSAGASFKVLLAAGDDISALTAITNSRLRAKDLVTGEDVPDTTDKADAVKLSANGEAKLGFVKSAKYVRASVISTGVTTPVDVSVIIQYEKAVQI